MAERPSGEPTVPLQTYMARGTSPPRRNNTYLKYLTWSFRTEQKVLTRRGLALADLRDWGKAVQTSYTTTDSSAVDTLRCIVFQWYNRLQTAYPKWLCLEACDKEL